MSGESSLRGSAGAGAQPIEDGICLDDPVAFLNAVGARVWSARDPDDCIGRLAQSLVPLLADWCVVGLRAGVVGTEDAGDTPTGPLPVDSRAEPGVTGAVSTRQSPRVAVCRCDGAGERPTVIITNSVPADLVASPQAGAALERMLWANVPYVFPPGETPPQLQPACRADAHPFPESPVMYESTAVSETVAFFPTETTAGRLPASPSAGAKLLTAVPSAGDERAVPALDADDKGLAITPAADDEGLASASATGAGRRMATPSSSGERFTTGLTHQFTAAMQAAGTPSCLVMPIRAWERHLGAVLIGSTRAGVHYGAQAVQLLQGLASTTATAVEYMRLRCHFLETRRRLQAERHLRTAIAETVGEGILVVDAYGRLQYANTAAQDKLGRTEAELLGHGADVAFRLHHQDVAPPATPCPLLRVLQTGQPYSRHEEVIIRRNGSPLHVSVAARPLHPDGELAGAVIAFRNVTPLKETQQRLEYLNAQLAEAVPRHTAELMEANRELEAFAYSVSHDLRAPLRTINGFSQALLEDYGDKLDDTARDYMERLAAASERMGELIDALLSLARVSRAELVRQEVDLSRMAASIARQLQRTEPQRAVEFHIQPGLKAQGDRILLRIALENLLGNAWKFTRRRSRAVIEVGQTIIDGQQAFFVHDNGVGFDMRYADKLFGAFQRLHPNQEFEGTGIGLATVQRIVRRHGGKIWGVGVVEGGATFYFTIPHGEAP